MTFQKLYVTFLEEDARIWNNITETFDAKPEPGRLGYAAVYNPGNAKTDKKNKDQHDWARYTRDAEGNYTEETDHHYVWPDGQIYTWDDRRGDHPEFYITENGYYRSSSPIHPLEESLKPAITLNITENGYYRNSSPILERRCTVSPLKESLKPAIIDNIPRTGFKVASTVSRYSTSNKLWRIMDPLGFELEISTKNMEDLIMTGTINRGEFDGLLVWDFGKNGIGKASLKRA